MSASRSPTICACVLAVNIVMASTRAMGSHSKRCPAVSFTLITPPLEICKTALLARICVQYGSMFGRAGREILEHLLYTFVEVLFIFLRLVREHVFRTGAPNELLCFCIVQVNYERSFFVVLFGCGCITESTKPTPTPSPTEAVIERLKRSLGLSRFNRHDGNVT